MSIDLFLIILFSYIQETNINVINTIDEITVIQYSKQIIPCILSVNTVLSTNNT